MNSDAFLVLWGLAGLAGILVMWRKGYLIEGFICAFLASILSPLMPIVLGGLILVAALALRIEHAQAKTVATTRQQARVATPEAVTQAASVVVQNL